MPDVPGRAELEARLARAIAKEQQAELRQLLDLMGDPPDPSKVPASFWDTASENLRAVVQPVLQELYLAQAQAVLGTISIGVDWALVNQAAIEWAQKYTFELVKGITARSAETLQTALGGFFQRPTTLAELEAQLAGTFGPVRAETIAVTEITRAAAEGDQGVIDRLLKDNPGIQTVDTWQTNNDDRVCLICGPRNGKKRGTNWTENPPAHPRCRCTVAHDFVMAK